MSVSKLPTGGWKVERRFKGVRIRKKDQHWTKEGAQAYEARDMARIMEALRNGQDPNAKEHTFAEALEYYERVRRTLQKGERRKMLDEFGHLPLKAIKPGMVREYAAKHWSHGQTRNCMGIGPVQAVINLAAKDHEWCGPISVERFSREKKRPSRATDLAWIQKFCAAARELEPVTVGCAELAMFIFLTGMRSGESATILLENVDWDKGTVWLPKTKTTGDITVEVPQELIPELQDMVKRRKRYVAMPCEYPDMSDLTWARLKRQQHKLFPMRDSPQISKYWKSISDHAGIEHFRPHESGRHSYATELVAAGYSAQDIVAMGRWKDVALLNKVYVHPSRKANARKAATLLLKGGAG